MQQLITLRNNVGDTLPFSRLCIDQLAQVVNETNMRDWSIRRREMGKVSPMLLRTVVYDTVLFLNCIVLFK